MRRLPLSLMVQFMPIEYCKTIEPCFRANKYQPNKIIKQAKATRRSPNNNPIQGRSY